jgi:Thiol-activated cytolysin
MVVHRRELLKIGGAYGALALSLGAAVARSNLRGSHRALRGSHRAEVLAYFRKLPGWDAFSPPVPDGNVRTNTPPTAPEVRDGLSCTRTEYSLSKNSDKLVMFEPDRDVLWPGALLQGRGYSDGLGSLKELPIKKRAPLKVGLALLTEKNYSTVAVPSATTVNDAISKMIAQAVQQKVNFGSSVSYTSTNSYSAEQAMLSVGISAKYAGASLSASHQSSSSSQQSSATTYFVQNMFTVFVEASLTPADLFSGDFSLNDLTEQESLGRIGFANIPVILSSISYGRILYVTTTAKATAAEIKTAVAASYSVGGNGGGAQLSEAQKNVLQNA